MIRVVCSIALFMSPLIVWANHTISEIDAKKLTELNVNSFEEPTGLEKFQVDSFRKSKENDIHLANVKIKHMQGKMHDLFEVERKEIKVRELLIAKNKERVWHLKLRKNLILIGFFTVFIVSATALFLFLRYKKEQKILAHQISRLVFLAGEEEKLRFSRELHDDFQATLSIIYIMSTYEFRKSPENVNYTEVKDRSNAAITEIRKISEELYPSEIKTVGLLESMKSLVKRTNALQTETNFHVHVDEMNCSSELRMIWYRIVQKLINDTLKNSSAQEVVMKLSTKAKGFELVYKELKFDQNASQRDLEFGLVSELVHALGGKFSFNSQTIDAYDFVVFFEEKQDLSIAKTLK